VLLIGHSEIKDTFLFSIVTYMLKYESASMFCQCYFVHLEITIFGSPLKIITEPQCREIGHAPGTVSARIPNLVTISWLTEQLDTKLTAWL
jgi:hypothetical protein